MWYDSRMDWIAEHLGPRGLLGTLALVALGSLGVGWRGAPPGPSLDGARRIATQRQILEDAPKPPDEAWAARAEAVRAGPVRVVSVRRDWVHELLSSGGSRCWVRATVGDEPSACFEVTNGVEGPMAWGPRSVDRC